MTAVDVDKLPPSQYLLMEVLVARSRLGEPYWSFPARLRLAADWLQETGWVEWENAGGDIRVRFTEAGRRVWLLDSYVSPSEKPIARVRALCEAAREDGQDLMRLTPSQVLAALDGRMG